MTTEKSGEPSHCPNCGRGFEFLDEEDMVRCRLCERLLACTQCWLENTNAIEILDRHLVNEHTDMERRFELCREAAILSAHGDFEYGLQFYEKAMDLDPNDAEPWYGCGVTYSNMEEYKKAAECFAKAIDLNPKHGYAKLALERIQVELDRRDADEERYLQEKGEKLLEHGDFERAKAVFKELLDRYPGNPESFNALGLIYGHLGDLNRAMRYFDACLERFDGNFSGLYANRGLILMKFNKFTDALESFERGLEYNDRILQLWYNMGIAAAQIGEYDRALEAFDRAIELNEEYYMAWFSKYVALKKLGRSEEAQEAFNRGYKLNPKYSLNFIGDDAAEGEGLSEHRSFLAAKNEENEE